MTYIKKEIEIIGARESINLNAMFDTGAQKNYLPCKFKNGMNAEDLVYNEFLGKEQIKLGNNTRVSGYFVKYDCLKLLGKQIKNPEFVLLQDLNHDAIIGNNLMQELKLVLDMEKSEITIKE